MSTTLLWQAADQPTQAASRTTVPHRLKDRFVATVVERFSWR
jgi:hypothetical protein